MKRTDFAGALYRYFRDYLVNDRGCSARTIEMLLYNLLTTWKITLIYDRRK